MHCKVTECYVYFLQMFFWVGTTNAIKTTTFQTDYSQTKKPPRRPRKGKEGSLFLDNSGFSQSVRGKVRITQPQLWKTRQSVRQRERGRSSLCKASPHATSDRGGAPKSKGLLSTRCKAQAVQGRLETKCVPVGFA